MIGSSSMIRMRLASWRSIVCCASTMARSTSSAV